MSQTSDRTLTNGDMILSAFKWCRAGADGARWDAAEAEVTRRCKDAGWYETECARLRADLAAERERAGKMREAMTALTVACEAEFEAPGVTDEEPDDEPVMSGVTGSTACPITFGMIRRARLALLDAAGGGKSP